MRGYPKHVDTKTDFDNLLKMPEHKKQALADLKRLQAIDDALITKVLTRSVPNPKAGEEYTAPGNDITEGPITLIEPDMIDEDYEVEIANPSPSWKQQGFATKKELDDLITAKEVAIDGK